MTAQGYRSNKNNPSEKLTFTEAYTPQSVQSR